jgi:hypothetical protein
MLFFPVAGASFNWRLRAESLQIAGEVARSVGSRYSAVAEPGSGHRNRTADNQWTEANRFTSSRIAH